LIKNKFCYKVFQDQMISVITKTLLSLSKKIFTYII